LAILGAGRGGRGGGRRDARKEEGRRRSADETKKTREEGRGRGMSGGRRRGGGRARTSESPIVADRGRGVRIRERCAASLPPGRQIRDPWNGAKTTTTIRGRLPRHLPQLLTTASETVRP
jgi:hypothetical protein